MLKEVANHTCVTFLSKDDCVYHGKVDPLQYDEVDYLKSKYNIEDFKFNNGGNQFPQQFYVASLDRVFVEPDHCIAIKGFSSIIKETVFYDWYKVSQKKYLKARVFSFVKIKRLEKAIIFDGTVGLNYFHFHNDILTKLDVVKKSFENTEVPLIISNKLFHSALFQFYYQFEFIKENKWYVLRDKEYVKVHKLYVIKAKQFDFVALNVIAEKTCEALKKRVRGSIINPGCHERIFINRKEKNGRYISNFQQLEPILTKYGFEVVYMEDLKMDEQIALAMAAKLIVGVHGAGLTNLIFSDRQNVRVIEIFPKNFVPTHYYWLCNSFSIQYKAFYAGDLLANQAFEIDIERFEKVISRYKHEVNSR